MNDLETLRESIAALEQEASDPRSEIRAQAMKALARRDYARKELQRRLLQRCNDAQRVDSVLQQLCEEGLLSDARFAASFIRHRAGQGYGPLRIRQELAQRGTDPEAIAVALEDSELDWRERAEQVRRKKFRGSLPEDFQSRARQLRFLAYRGFETSDLGC